MGRNSRRRQKLPPEPLYLRIQRLGHDGRGIASIEGKLAFVSGALPGEEVLAQCTSRRTQYDEFSTVSVLESSPDRVEPRCPVTALCGGCSMQHLAEQKQLIHKQQFLLDQLKHGAGIETFELLPPVLGLHYFYRRKARLAVRYVHKKEDTLVGFREKNGRFIVDMQQCPILVKPVSDLISPLRSLLNQLEGKRDIPQIEVAAGELPTQQLSAEIDPESYQVALILRHMEALSTNDRASLIEFARKHSLALYLQPKGPDSIHQIWPENQAERLHYYLPGNLTLPFHPADFTQINGEINRKMIAAALSLLDLKSNDVVLDLFCGLGNFTLPMAQHCAKVVGVEGSQQMVERGFENARCNRIQNVDFHAADLSVDFGQDSWGRPGYTKILLDPPRSGAIEIIPRLAELKASKIVYISCNPTTLARDAAELGKLGYKLTRAGILDMFPHTSHVESIAEFELQKNRNRSAGARVSRKHMFQ
ncbi:MAG: 23S rRNA (uracil(1939)-C(5))-methyltransferase RlmD [Pseudomonadales bacterium]|nr:23S rRNA (uracil(1939)-C(5))-methyltransferase RlmD [Pseudomonadales bacterium]